MPSWCVPGAPASEPLADISVCVEVVYAEPRRVRCCRLELAAPASVADALAAAAADPQFADLALEGLPVGIFGRRVAHDQMLTGGDRVELYRALPADPKSARRARVETARRRGPRR
jgi:putative ubiquitin-RnfH superfamily antitoxin RatB of RatAB toxin-antitoxin module